MSKNIQTEIIINSPKEKVWNILTDFENYRTWNPFIIESSAKVVAGTKFFRNSEWCYFEVNW